MSDIGNALAQYASDLSEMQIFDTYKIPEESLINFNCPNKGINVWAVVVEPWLFNLESKWDSKAIGALSDSSLLHTVDTLAQDFAGVSINQPIFNRRVWGGTSPFETSVKIRFVAQQDGYWDVYLPVIEIAALLIPRLVTGVPGIEGLLGIFAVPGPAPFGGFALTDILKALNINTPKNQFAGDSVSIKFGNIIDISNAYITKVQGMFSRSLDSKGYPLAAELTVSFSSMDTPFFVSDPSRGKTDNDQVALTRNNILHSSNATAVDVVGATLETIQAAITKVQSAQSAAGAVVPSTNSVDAISGASSSTPKGSNAISGNSNFLPATVDK